MDNTAQGSPVGEMQQKVSVQPDPVSQAGTTPMQQEPTQVSQPLQQQPAAPVSQAPTSVPHPIARPMEAPVKPQTAAPRRESGPVATMAPVVDTEDEQPVVQQEAPIIQQSHPEVVMPQEVAEAGVEAGQDAKKEQLPEVKQTFTEAGDIQPVITAVQPTTDIHLQMSLEEAQLAAKKTRSIRSGLSWILRQIIRQWRKKEAKEEEA